MRIMENSYQIFPHKILSLDYTSILPVLKWLIEELRQTRDTRGAVNKKQGLLNYSIFYEHDAKPAPVDFDAQKLNRIIFNNKPKRV